MGLETEEYVKPSVWGWKLKNMLNHLHGAEEYVKPSARGWKLKNMLNHLHGAEN